MIGAINYQLDYELIVRVAQAFPRDQVIMGGKTLGKNSAPSGNQLAALQRLQQMSNVHMLGFIPPTKVPSYVKAFDVCLMPFIQHRSIEECDPLKFYEFMAMGKPVVTTPVPVTRDHPDLAYVANSREEFIRLVGDVLDHPEPESKSSRRVEFAQAHDWSAIVETALSVLQRIDGKKAATSHA
jgi:glycosyltransferase involved in cell wall biosynthesis